MKLILKVYYGDGYTYSCDGYIAFEYESKDKFVFDIFEKYNNLDSETKEMLDNNDENKVRLFIDGPYLSKFEIEDIERNVFEYGSDEFFNSFNPINIEL